MRDEPARPATDAVPMFELSGVTLEIGGKRLLGPLDLRVAAGRITGVIGHNGSGKSSLAKILARQQPPSAGTVRHAGRPLADWSTKAFARTVAYMAQDNPPAAGMLVRELVALGRYPWLGALGRAGDADRDAVAKAMDATDVTRFAERLVPSLSGGERQRVFLALMLAQEAACLILDEPISALDVTHQVGMLRLLRRVSLERELGAIVVLHDVNMASRFCDEIIALHSGREIARGEPASIMTPDVLRSIYDAEFGIFEHPDNGHATAYVR